MTDLAPSTASAVPQIQQRDDGSRATVERSDIFRDELGRLDASLREDLAGLPQQLDRIPLDVWGTVLLNPERYLPRRGHFLPRMPPVEVQDDWTGNHGPPLLQQSLAFVRLLVGLAGDELRAGPVLDYGVGWGRLSRLLLKYVPIDRLHGADAWSASLDHSRNCGIPHRLYQVSCRLEPGEIRRDYSVIYAFSVFTHLSPDAFAHNLAHLVAGLRPGGRLIMTVRPSEYWTVQGRVNPRLAAATLEEGVGHQPSQARDYGETAVASWWVEAQLRDCGLVDIGLEWNARDPLQLIWSGSLPLTTSRAGGDQDL